MASAIQKCRICLSFNVKMFTLKNTSMENLYQLLTQVYVDIDDGKPTMVCFLCYVRLQQCYRLQQKAIKSNELLEQLLTGGIKQATANAIINNQYTSNLQVSTMYHLDLEPTTHKDILIEPKVESWNDCPVSVKVETEAIDEERKDVHLIMDFSEDGYDPYGFFPEASHSDSKEDKQITAIGSYHCDGIKDDGHGLEQRKQQDEEKICNVQSEKELKNDPVPPKSTQNQQKDEDVEKNTKIKLKPKKNAFVTKKEKNQKAINKCVDGRSDSTATKNCNSYKRKLGKSKTEIVTKKSKFQIPVTNKDTIKETNIGSETTLSNTTTKEIRCNKYDEKFSTNEVLTDRHLNCTERAETLVNAQELTKKTLNSSVPDMYSCDICTFKTNNKRCIEPHLKMHTVSKIFSCHICEYRSAQKSHLKTHVRIHTGEKPFNCKICDYKCAHKTTLKNHMRTHTGEKPFICNICDFKCAHKTSLKNHMRTHTGEKPFNCKICDYKCARKIHLNDHMRTHTGEKPFNCKICDFKCAHKTSLKNHMRTHTGEKPFICKICDYKSAQKIHLNDHMRTHTGDKPFSCDMCDYRCIQKSNLKKHLRTHK